MKFKSSRTFYGILGLNEDTEALAAGMQPLMSNKQERQRLGIRPLEITERFSLNKVMGMGEELLNEFSKRNPLKLENLYFI
jgi:hypothetical protein